MARALLRAGAVLRAERALVVAFTVASLCGCAPSLPPFVSAETADVLAPGTAALSVGGGGAALTTDLQSAGLCCAGVETRARVGIGAAQELSVTDAVSTTDGVWTLSSRVGWKRALASWAAVEVGADLLVHDFSHRSLGVLGTDSGVLVSVPESGRFRRLQPYTGLRATALVPLAADPFSGPGVAWVFSAPAGVALHASRAARLFVEGGLVAIETRYGAGPDLFSYPLGGAYGALAFEVTLR